MKVVNLVVILFLVACSMGAEENDKPKTSSGKMGEPMPPSDLPKAAGSKQDGKEKDLKSAETFGFGYYGGVGVGVYPYGIYPPYYNYPYLYGGYPFKKFYKYGYGGYPYFGYRAYPFYGHHHWPYWG